MINPLFLRNTRQNIMQLPSKAFTLDTTTQFDLPKAGYLSRLFLTIKGTMTLTAADNAIAMKDTHDSQPFGLIKELRIKLNSGTTLIKVPGYHLYLLNLLRQRSQFPDVGGASLDAGYANSRPYAFANVASGAGTANTWRFTLQVPIALNELDLEGLILLQTSDTIVTVEIEWAKDSDLFTLGGGETAVWAGSVYPAMEIFSVPSSDKAQPYGEGARGSKPDALHGFLYHEQPINATGEFVYDFERGNVYLRAINRVVLNAARAGLTDITRLTIRYNGNHYPYQNIDADLYAALQRERYGRDLPQGVFVWDWHYQGTPAYATSRDWIASHELAEFEQLLEIASTATLGANNNKLEVTREILIPF